MSVRDRLEIVKRKTQVPPRVLARVGLSSIPFPHDADSDFPCEFPEKAFDANTGELLFFYESHWSDYEKKSVFNERLLPFLVSSDIADGSFSHELGAIDDYSPESLQAFIAEHGWLFLPYFDSQKRFIDFRYHSSYKEEGGGYFQYDMAYPGANAEDRLILNSGSDGHAGLLMLEDAVDSVWAEALWQASTKPLYGDDIRMESISKMAAAVILSEYARRSLLVNKSLERGGVVSYYEVFLTIRLLQKSMRIVEEYDVAGHSLEMLSRGIEFASDDPESETIRRKVRRLIDNPDFTELQKVHAVHNLYQNDLRKALHFLSLCAFSCPGTSNIALKRAEPSGDDLYGEGRWVSTRHIKLRDREFDMELLDTERYLRRVNPLYFDNIYAEGSYSAAVAAQFLDVVNSDLEWRLCKNPECGKYFKLKYAPGKSTTRNRQGDYCCDKCGSDTRNRRNNAEQRILTNARRRFNAGKPGYETLDNALASIEEDMLPYFEESDFSKLPKARERWRAKLLKKK